MAKHCDVAKQRAVCLAALLASGSKAEVDCRRCSSAAFGQLSFFRSGSWKADLRTVAARLRSDCCSSVWRALGCTYSFNTGKCRGAFQLAVAFPCQCPASRCNYSRWKHIGLCWWSTRRKNLAGTVLCCTTACRKIPSWMLPQLFSCIGLAMLCLQSMWRQLMPKVMIGLVVLGYWHHFWAAWSVFFLRRAFPQCCHLPPAALTVCNP